jgi:predicted nucleic acid-binding protein
MPQQTLFADSFYWIALIFLRDAFHSAVVAFSRNLAAARLVTTDEVLTEFLNHFAALGPYWRHTTAAFVHVVRSNPQVEVLPQTRADFDAALAMYESRLDKDYSLTDCRSMAALRSLGISDVLTSDHHFTQEGFRVLFP